MAEPLIELVDRGTGEYRFQLRDANGQIIAKSLGCDTKEKCIENIHSLKNVSTNKLHLARISRDFRLQRRQHILKIPGSSGRVTVLVRITPSVKTGLDFINLVKKRFSAADIVEVSLQCRKRPPPKWGEE